MIVSLLEDRRDQAGRRLEGLRTRLASSDVDLRAKACVYVTGSFGRAEAGQHSDLDLFIVGLTETDNATGETRRALSPPEEVLVKADLIRAAKKLEFPEFDRDGEFLVHHSVDDLVKTLGHPRDDAVNTFTARLLLLLESRALLEESVYDSVIDKVIEAYWIDFAGHEQNFLPAYLANDILRLWRTFCVNYEAFTRREPEEERAKRRLKNYKLRHSRLLTCYSALGYFLEIFRRNSTVRPNDARDMIRLTPTERLEWLAVQNENSKIAQHARTCLELYEGFLRETDAPRTELIEKFRDRGERRRLGEAESQFGDEMFELLKSIDSESKLFRLLVI